MPLPACADRRLLLRRTGNDDQEVGRRLRVHHGDVRPVHGLHPAVDRVHDRAAVLAGDRRADVQHVRDEAVLPGLPAARRFGASAGRVLYQ